MDTNHIIIAVVVIILLFLIIKFTKKVIKFILITIVIIGLGLYAFLFLNKISNINDLHSKYCDDTSNKNDSLKCVCIIEPIEDDFESRFSKEERENMKSGKFALELAKSLKNKRTVIKNKLKENNALNLLDDFKKDFL